jgi:hypothetical protein
VLYVWRYKHAAIDVCQGQLNCKGESDASQGELTGYKCRLLFQTINSNPHSQANPLILWCTKVHSRVHNSPPSVRILGQMDPVNALTCYFFNIHFNIILLWRLTSSKWSFTFRFLEGRRDSYFPTLTGPQKVLQFSF